MPIPNIPPGFKVADIKTELGSTNNSLKALGGLANPPLGSPFLMSEFANYTHSASSFYRNDGVNDYAQITGGVSSNAIGSGALTFSFWVRQNATSHQNAQIINIAPGFSSSDRLMIDYNTTNNQLRFNHRQGSSNSIKAFYMNNNTSKTGLSGAWSASNRGTVNGNGWNMLTYVYDGKQSGLNGLTVWWNNQQLDHQVNTSGSRGNLSMTNIRFGENIHNVGSAGNAHMDIDEFKIYSRLLSSTEINSLYQAGSTNPASAAAAGVTGNLISNVRFDGSQVVDLEGHFTNDGSTFNGGQIIAY